MERDQVRLGARIVTPYGRKGTIVWPMVLFDLVGVCMDGGVDVPPKLYKPERLELINEQEILVLPNS